VSTDGIATGDFKNIGKIGGEESRIRILLKSRFCPKYDPAHNIIPIEAKRNEEFLQLKLTQYPPTSAGRFQKNRLGLFKPKLP
jgi:hypothetical protein